jgi:hypothetical protein
MTDPSASVVASPTSLVRDLVDERFRAMRAREAFPPVGTARPDLTELFARLRQVAARTRYEAVVEARRRGLLP